MGIIPDYELGVPVLQEWLKAQKHLPRHFETPLLRRFIYSCYGDLDKTKKLIETNYSYRNLYSHIFLKRDPCDEKTKNVLECTDMLVLPGVTETGNKVLLYRLNTNVDPDKFNFTEAVKVFFMLADARFAICDPTYGGINGGEVPIFDMSGFTFKHLTKIVLSTLRIYMKFTQEAQPIRLKEIHVINCSPFLDKVLTIVKPFIKSEVFKLIKFHVPDSKTLYQTVPKDMLPYEYGGNSGSINEIKTEWIDTLISKRDYLMDEKYWKTEEKKSNNSTMKAVHDILKNLNID